MAVMSGWGMGICFQLFVSRLVLISKIDLVASGAEVLGGWVYCEPLKIGSGHSIVVNVRFLNSADVEIVSF